MQADSRGFYRSDAGKLRQAMAQVADKRTYIRMRAVLLWCEGREMKEITGLLSKTRQIVHRWVRVFLAAHDPFSLCERERSGRPPVAPSITTEGILDALRMEPTRAGYRVNAWTVSTLAD